MSQKPDLSPDECRNMTDVRAGVDAIDAQLIELLKLRFEYMDAAARIKETRESVRDEERKAQVLTNVEQMAAEAGLPDGLVAQLWEILVENSISHEFEKWDSLRSS